MHGDAPHHCSLFAPHHYWSLQGYALSSVWLGPACPEPVNVTITTGAGSNCPLPAWLKPDGVYHASLAVSYTVMAVAASLSMNAAAAAVAVTTEARGSVNAAETEALLPTRDG